MTAKVELSDAPAGARQRLMFSISLRALRKERGLTRREVERRTAGLIRQSSLGMWEQGKRQPGLRHLAALADLYRIPLAELMRPIADADYTPPPDDIILSETEARRLGGPLERFLDSRAAMSSAGGAVRITPELLPALSVLYGCTEQQMRDRLTQSAPAASTP